MSEPAELYDRLNAAADKAEAGSQIIHDFANSDEFSDIDTESGPISSLAKLVRLYSLTGQTFQQDILGATPRPWVDKARESVSIEDFGAKFDGITDDTAAWQMAFDSLCGKGYCLDVPSGETIIDASKGVRVTGSLTIRGRGKTVSLIKYNNYPSDSVNRPVFYTDSPIVAGSCFDIDGIGIIGKWGENEDFTETNSFTSIFNFSKIAVTGCWMKGSRSGGLVCGNADQVLVTLNTFENMYRDSTRVANSHQSIVTNNFYKNILDDCVSVYSSDSNVLNIENSVIVSGNNIVDSQGILVAGGKVVSIEGNNIIRATHRAIYVGQTPVEFETGNTPVISIKIRGNNIIDGFDGLAFSPLMGSGFRAIHVEGTPLVAKDTIETGNPVVAPQGYMYLNNTDDSGQPNAGGFNINVSGNTVTRTLPATSAYSSYGFGQRLSRSGWVDPAITLEQMMGTGIDISLAGNTLDILDNQVDGCLDNIKVACGTAPNGVAMRNFRFDRNTLKDCRRHLLTITGNGHVDITGNTFDADPYHKHSGRAAAGNGSWDSVNYSTCRAIDLGTGVTASVDRNSFKNTGVMVWQGGIVYTGITSQGNKAFCQPAATGWNANNKGIGFVTRATQLQLRYMIMGSDPTDQSTFKKVTFSPAISASAMPTSGTYVAGHLVYADTADATLAWKRLTTGSAHVASTDWIAV